MATKPTRRWCGRSPVAPAAARYRTATGRPAHNPDAEATPLDGADGERTALSLPPPNSALSELATDG
jgi:hypothetical protein